MFMHRLTQLVSKVYFQFFAISFFLFLDQFSKWLARHHLDESISFMGLLFTNIENKGFAFSSFHNLPEFFRISFTSGFGLFFLILYLFLNFSITKPVPLIRWGLIFFISGILGNVFDRILRGFATDLISLNTPFHMPVINLADIFQFVGFFSIFCGFYLYRKVIFYDKDKRFTFWISHEFQKKFCFIFASAGLGFSVIITTFFYTFLKITLKTSYLSLAAKESVIQTAFVIIFIYTALFVALLIFTALLYSHRIIGPFNKFKKFILSEEYKTSRPLKLRSGDELIEVEELAKKLQDDFSKK